MRACDACRPITVRVWLSIGGTLAHWVRAVHPFRPKCPPTEAIPSIIQGLPASGTPTQLRLYSHVMPPHPGSSAYVALSVLPALGPHYSKGYGPILMPTSGVAR